MAVSVPSQSLFCKSEIIHQIWRLFRHGATQRERILADVITTLARYAKHSTTLVDNNSDDLEILLAVSTVLHRVGKL